MEIKSRQNVNGSSNSWFYWPVEYISRYFYGDSTTSNESTISSKASTLEQPTGNVLSNRNSLFENSFKSPPNKLPEDHYYNINGSGNNNLDEGPAEYSLQGIYVPANLEDWSAFSASLPDSAFPRYKMVLPKKTKILALDLDETLVHSTSKSSGECDYFVEVLVDRCSCLYYVFKRPFVDHFLETVSTWYHLVIYTASLKEYAEPVVNWLDRGRGLFKKRLFRTACIEQMGMFIKNLTLVDNDLSRVCLLDNSPSSFLMHPDNGIPIDSWMHDRTDTCLLDILPLLDALRFTDDVRSILSMRRF